MIARSSVNVSKRYQIVLPIAVRRELNIEAGDRLIVDVQDGVLILIPQPEDYVESLSGLLKELWSDVDTDVYLQRERDSWSPSGSDPGASAEDTRI